jgi:hypothetical protein
VNRRDVFDVDEDRALDALRLAWGDAYDIGFEQDRWVARHRDASGDLLTGTTPDELNAAIRADWATRSTR